MNFTNFTNFTNFQLIPQGVMRSLILILQFLLLCVSLNGQLIIENRLWSITEGGYPACGCKCDSLPQYCSSHYLKISGDTIIDKTAYKVLHKSHNIDTTEWSNEGFIRETTEGEIYYRRDKNKEELLLYDFGCEVSDTIISNYEYESSRIDSVELIVDSIKTVKYEGISRKTIYLNPVSPDYQSQIWMEGIGSTKGFLNTFVPEVTGGCSYLQCCFDDDFCIYNSDCNDKCFYENQTNSISKSETSNLINIYPNPAKEYFIIELSGAYSEFLFTLIAIDGQICFKKRLSGQNSFNINTANLQNGVYLYRIYDHDKCEIRNGKIILY